MPEKYIVARNEDRSVETLEEIGDATCVLAQGEGGIVTDLEQTEIFSTDKNCVPVKDRHELIPLLLGPNRKSTKGSNLV